MEFRRHYICDEARKERKDDIKEKIEFSPEEIRKPFFCLDVYSIVLLNFTRRSDKYWMNRNIDRLKITDITQLLDSFVKYVDVSSS